MEFLWFWQMKCRLLLQTLQLQDKRRKTKPERRYRVLIVTLRIGNSGRLHFSINFGS